MSLLLTGTGSGAGELEVDSGSILTPLEKEVLTELQKVLLTVNNLNDAILATIADIGAVETSQRGAVDKGLAVLGGETETEIGSRERE